MNRQLLVVDDNPDIRLLLGGLLEHFGYTVAMVESGQKAMEWLKTYPIDAVISDIFMPNGNGTWLIGEMRKQGFTIPIFLITAGADITKKQALAFGANGFFRKPLDIDTLETALEQALA